MLGATTGLRRGADGPAFDGRRRRRVGSPLGWVGMVRFPFELRTGRPLMLRPRSEAEAETVRCAHSHSTGRRRQAPSLRKAYRTAVRSARDGHRLPVLHGVAGGAEP